MRRAAVPRACPLLKNQKRALSFCFLVRLYRKTASHFSGRTLADDLDVSLEDAVAIPELFKSEAEFPNKEGNEIAKRLGRWRSMSKRVMPSGGRS